MENKEMELLPCPFCGGSVELEMEGTQYKIRCNKWGCIIQNDFIEHTKEGAVNKWHTRHDARRELDAQIEKEIDRILYNVCIQYQHYEGAETYQNQVTKFAKNELMNIIKTFKHVVDVDLKKAVSILESFIECDNDSFVDAGSIGNHRTEHICIGCGSSFDSEHDDNCPVVEAKEFLKSIASHLNEGRGGENCVDINENMAFNIVHNTNINPDKKSEDKIFVSKYAAEEIARNLKKYKKEILL